MVKAGEDLQWKDKAKQTKELQQGKEEVYL
jgi:hypothetical protein